MIVFQHVFFYPGMLLLYWQCVWSHCHSEKQSAQRYYLINGQVYYFVVFFCTTCLSFVDQQQYIVCVQMLFSQYSQTVLVFSYRSCQPHLRSLGLEVHFSHAADLKVFVGKVPLCFMEKESNELRRGRPSVIKPIAEVKLFTVSLFFAK